MPKAAQPRGNWGHAPLLESRVSEMPLLAFSAEHFQQINTEENVVVSCLFYSSRVLSVRKYIAYAKKKASDAIRIME